MKGYMLTEICCYFRVIFSYSLYFCLVVNGTTTAINGIIEVNSGNKTS